MSFKKLSNLENKDLIFLETSSPRFIKFEKVIYKQKDYQTGELISEHFLGVRIYINLNTPTHIRETEVFDIKIKMERPEGEICDKYYLHPRYFNYFYKKFLKDIFDSIQTGDNRKISKFMTTYDEILSINSSNSKDNFTCLTILFETPTSQEEAERIKSLQENIKNPDDNFLTSLTDFSSIPIDFNFEINSKKISSSEAKAKIDKIFEESKLTKEIISELKSKFNINAYLDFVDKKSNFWDMLNPKNWNDEAKKLLTGKTPREIFLENESLGSGGIMLGPPGTGKTHMVKNTIWKIYEEVFGFKVIEIPMSDLSKGASYYGALLQAVTNIFQKGLETIQKTRKPVLIFVDESDRLIKKSSREDDNDGFAAMKNFINPSRYPGIQLCLVTNILDKGEMNEGIIERRLHPIFIDYPDLETTKKVWEYHIKNKIFGLIYNPIFKDNNGNDINNDEVYILLGKLVANKVGLDLIENFCKQYRSITNTKVNEPISNFNQFKILFYKSSSSRISTLESSALNQFRHENRHLVSDHDINKIKSNYQEIRDNLDNAFNGKDQEDLDKERFELLQSFKKKDSNNILYQKFFNLKNNYNTYSNLSQIDLTRNHALLFEIYEDSEIIEKYFQSFIQLIKKDYSSNQAFIQRLAEIINYIKEFSEKKLALEGDEDILVKNSKLMKSEKIVITSRDQENFFVLVKHFLDELPDDFFNIVEVEEKNLENFQNISELTVENLNKKFIFDQLDLINSNLPSLLKGYHDQKIPKESILSILKSLDEIKKKIILIKEEKGLFNIFKSRNKSKIILCDSLIKLFGYWLINPSISSSRFNAISMRLKSLSDQIKDDFKL